MKVLIVEDNLKLNEGIKAYLEEEGFDVDTAFNGVQALSIVKENLKKAIQFDVIIMDRMMPMKEGVEVMREMKGIGIISSFILLTAKDSVDDKIFGLAAGADDYMVKPFNIRELVARIHNLYRRNVLENKNTISINKEINKDIRNSFTFNANNNEIIINNDDKEKVIILTSKESDIFKILFEANENIVSKENILERIWKEKGNPSSRFVDVHLHNLRSKLIENNFVGKIDTIRNEGYRLIF